MKVRDVGKRFMTAVMGCLMVCLMEVPAAFPAFAAQKAISGVSIRVGVNMEAGDTLRDIQIYEDSTDVQDDAAYAGTNSLRYMITEAEWITSENDYIDIGQQPKMRIYLETIDSDYAFRGTYGSGNVTVKGGSLISARRQSPDTLVVVASVNGVKGQYVPPDMAEWRSGYGRAAWGFGYDYDEYAEAVTSGYYDVYLYRGNTVIHKLEDYHGTSYNFYPYMTRPGTYSFRVRTVPHTEEQKKYGKRSEWTESDEFYLDEEHVSDGSGQTNAENPGQTGWIFSDNTWYFRYPNGMYQRNGWLQLQGIWYLFDNDGRMLTGWQQTGGQWYYLQNNGAMLTGWIKGGDYWYYMNTLADGGTEGAMRTGWLNLGGKIYFLDSNGIMAEGWRLIGENYYYFYPGAGNMATNTVIDNYFWVDANGVWVH